MLSKGLLQATTKRSRIYVNSKLLESKRLHLTSFGGCRCGRARLTAGARVVAVRIGLRVPSVNIVESLLFGWRSVTDDRHRPGGMREDVVADRTQQVWLTFGWSGNRFGAPRTRTKGNCRRRCPAAHPRNLEQCGYVPALQAPPRSGLANGPLAAGGPGGGRRVRHACAQCAGSRCRTWHGDDRAGHGLRAGKCAR